MRACPRAVAQRRTPGSPGGAPVREERPAALGRPAPGAPRAAVVLAPFTRSTDPDVAAALLMHHARYHLRMGLIRSSNIRRRAALLTGPHQRGAPPPRRAEGARVTRGALRRAPSWPSFWRTRC